MIWNVHCGSPRISAREREAENWTKSVNTFLVLCLSEAKMNVKTTEIDSKWERERNCKSFAQVLASDYPQSGKYENGNRRELNTYMKASALRRNGAKHHPYSVRSCPF